MIAVWNAWSFHTKLVIDELVTFSQADFCDNSPVGSISGKTEGAGHFSVGMTSGEASAKAHPLCGDASSPSHFASIPIDIQEMHDQCASSPGDQKRPQLQNPRIRANIAIW